MHMLGLLTFLDRSDTKAAVVKAATSLLAPPSFLFVRIFKRQPEPSMAPFVLPWHAPLRCRRPGRRGGGVDSARGGAELEAGKRGRCRGGAGLGAGKRGSGRGGRNRVRGRNKKTEKRHDRRIKAAELRRERVCLVAQVADFKAAGAAALWEKVG
jgi:hypothetical protein